MRFKSSSVVIITCFLTQLKPYFFLIIPVISFVFCHIFFPVYFLSFVLYSFFQKSLKKFFFYNINIQENDHKEMFSRHFLINSSLQFPTIISETQINHNVNTPPINLLSFSDYLYHQNSKFSSFSLIFCHFSEYLCLKKLKIITLPHMTKKLTLIVLKSIMNIDNIMARFARRIIRKK